MPSLKHSLPLFLLVATSCAGGMDPLQGNRAVLESEDGVVEGEVAPFEQEATGTAPVAGPDVGVIAPPVDGIATGVAVGQMGGNGLTPDAGPIPGQIPGGSPTGQIFGIPISGTGATGSLTPETNPEGENEGTGKGDPVLTYHESVAAPADAPLPSVPLPPSVDSNPIVVCAPDTICYGEEMIFMRAAKTHPCSYKELKNKELGVEVIDTQVAQLSRSEVIVKLLGKVVTGDGEENRQHCAVEIRQETEWTKSVVTNSSGIFGVFLRKFHTTPPETGDGDTVLAEFYLQVYSTDKQPIPLGDPTTIVVEVPREQPEVIYYEPDKPKPLLKPPRPQPLPQPIGKKEGPEKTGARPDQAGLACNFLPPKSAR